MKLIGGIVLSTLAALSLSTLVNANEEGAKRGHHHKGPSFEKLDANADGQVSAEELQAIGAARFARMDANADGQVTQEELIASETKRAEKRAKHLIERMDADGDGVLTSAELARPERTNKMIARFDADKNGTLSAEEFEAAKAKMGKPHGKKKKADRK